MSVQTYLFFDGRCEEALDFYKQAVNAKVTFLMHFKDNPTPGQDGCGPDTPSGDKVMHCAFTIGDTTLMASDGFAKGKPSFEGFYLSISAASDAEAKKLFAALGEGGSVNQPLSETFFASSFGMLTDRFGVQWMVLAPKPM